MYQDPRVHGIPEVQSDRHNMACILSCRRRHDNSGPGLAFG